MFVERVRPLSDLGKKIGKLISGALDYIGASGIPFETKETISSLDNAVVFFREARKRAIGFNIPSEVRHEMIVSYIRQGAFYALCADEIREEIGRPSIYDRNIINRLLRNYTGQSNNLELL